MINPKEQFLAKLPPDSNFRNVIMSDVFQNALTYSYAQLALQTRSPEHLEGARQFVDILTNIGTPVAPQTTFPDKSLDHSVFYPKEKEETKSSGGTKKKKKA